MTDRTLQNLPASARQRLTNISRERGEDFQFIRLGSLAMRFVLQILLFLCVTSLVRAQDKPVAADAKWRSLPLVQEGRIDSRWTHLWGGNFVVVGEGVLRTACSDAGMGLLLYTPEKFGNCQIRVVYRCQNARCNSGVYVRIDGGVLDRKADPLPVRERDSNGSLTAETIQRLQKSSEEEREAWYPVHHGYEVQIDDSGDAYHRTGAIYSLAPAVATSKPPADGWRTMIITLQGELIVVDIDGQRVSTFDPNSPDVPQRKNWTEPKREPKRPLAGYLGLQNHDPGDVVDFKEVSVRPLSGVSGAQP